jgi:hypothetical protein
VTTLQVTPQLVLLRDDNGGTLAIGTELRCFVVIRHGVLHRVWVVVVILLHLGGLVREARGGKNVTTTGEERVMLRLS